MFNVYTKGNVDYRQSPEGDLIINPSREVLERLAPAEIKNIEINDSMGMVHDPRHLTNFNSIESLAIVMIRDLNLDFLEKLENLRRLRITRGFQQKIDLAWFSKLESLQVDWNEKIVGLSDAVSLERLRLWGYKGRVGLSEFSRLDKLRELEFVHSTVTSLEGLNDVAPLESIKLTNCKKLTSLRGIEKFSSLRSIDWEGSSISDLDPLRNTKNLESLGIHDGKKIASLSPLKDLKKLQLIYITGKTEIIDGDMTPLIGRKDALITPRKYYSHSGKEIDKLNGSVRPKNTWEY